MTKPPQQRNDPIRKQSYLDGMSTFLDMIFKPKQARDNLGCRLIQVWFNFFGESPHLEDARNILPISVDDIRLFDSADLEVLISVKKDER